MPLSPEQQPSIYISQYPYRFSDIAMESAEKIKESLGLERIGVEIIPFRWQSTNYFLGLKREHDDMGIAVAGVTTASYRDFGRDLGDFFHKPSVFIEVLKNIAGVGAQSEPLWTRKFRSHLTLAIALDASYLAMHEESTRLLEEQGLLESWLSTSVIYGRKMGWGPDDDRPQVLSWDAAAIRDFVEAYQKKGGNIAAILPTDTAFRNGETDILKIREILHPRVIQIADYEPDGKIEKLAPGKGRYKGELAELIQETFLLAPDTILTVEVGDKRDVRSTVEFILRNWRA